MRLIPFRRKKLNQAKFTKKWQELQQYCMNRKTWPEAIKAADDLVAEALRKKRFKGKTTGERLVAAQHDLSKNETVWLGHKLRGRLEQTDVDVRKLRKRDVLTSLAGFRQALRDLGALKKEEKVPEPEIVSPDDN